MIDDSTVSGLKSEGVTRTVLMSATVCQPTNSTSSIITKKTNKVSNYTGIRPEQFWSSYYDTGGLYILNGRTVKHMSLKQACCRVV